MRTVLSKQSVGLVRRWLFDRVFELGKSCIYTAEDRTTITHSLRNTTQTLSHPTLFQFYFAYKCLHVLDICYSSLSTQPQTRRFLAPRTFLLLSPLQPLVIRTSSWLQTSRPQRHLRLYFQHWVLCKAIVHDHRKHMLTNTWRNSRNQYATSIIRNSGRS